MSKTSATSWARLVPLYLAQYSAVHSPATNRLRTAQLRAARTALPPLRRLTTAHLTAYLASYGHPVTYASHLAALRGFLAWCVDQGHLVVNVAKPIRTPPKPVYYARPVPDAVLAQALATATGADLMILVLAGVLGMRRSEVAAAHSRNYNRRTGRLRVLGKGRRLRDIPVPVEYRPVIEAQHGWLVPSPHKPNQPVRPETVYVWAKRLLAGEYTTHQLRHRAGVSVQNIGHDLRLTQDFLGHASPTTTVIYTRPTAEALEAVLAESGQKVCAQLCGI